MSAPIVDIYLVYQFMKRLVTPFNKTEAFKLGLIDEHGKRLKKASTPEEKRAMGYFDRLVFNLKRLLAKVPGGKTLLASYVAALLLLREQDDRLVQDENFLEEQFRREFNRTNMEHFGEVEELVEALGNPCWKGYKAIGMKTKGGRKVPNCVPVGEDAPANATGAGVVGTGDNKAHWSQRQPRIGQKGKLKKYGQPINVMMTLRRKKLPEQKVYYKMLGRYVKPSKSSSGAGDGSDGSGE